MRQRWGRRTTSAVAAATVLVVGLSAWGIAAIPDAGGVIHACVESDGDVRLIDPDAPRESQRSCTSREREVEWNQRGQQGAPGQDGPAGPAGPPGRTVCKAEDLLLCLPDRGDLRPRLTDGTVEIEGEAYRIEMDAELQKYLEADPKGPQFGRFIVDGTKERIVVVAPMDAADHLLAWFAQVRRGQTAAFRDVFLELFDGEERVLHAMLRNAIPVSVRLDGDRVQVTLQPEEVLLAE